MDREVLRKRSQEPITFTVVQFAGNKEAAKHYEPGYGYYQESAVSGKVKLKIYVFRTNFEVLHYFYEKYKIWLAFSSRHWKKFVLLKYNGLSALCPRLVEVRSILWKIIIPTKKSWNEKGYTAVYRITYTRRPTYASPLTFQAHHWSTN